LNRYFAPSNNALSNGLVINITGEANFAFILFSHWWNPKRSRKVTES